MHPLKSLATSTKFSLASDVKDFRTRPRNFDSKASQLLDPASSLGWQTDRINQGQSAAGGIRPDLFPTRPHFKYLNNRREVRAAAQMRSRRKKEVVAGKAKYQTMRQTEP